MAVEIKVPPLGESVTEATIAKWHKKQGDYVKNDELLVELETDKVTLEVNAPQAGTLQTISVQEGDTVQVNALLAVLTEGGTAPAVATSVETAKQAAPKAPPATSIPSPAASKMIKESALNSQNINPTGKDGRITKGDVINALATTPTQAIVAQNRIERVRMSRLRKRIAERLKESQNTAAILTTFNEVDMSAVMNLRNRYKDSFEKKHQVKLGFMSFFVKAAVNALQEIPSVNAEIDGDDIVYKNFYDIGVAVGTEQGLVVPVLRNADQLSFAEIEKTIAGLGKKARDGKLSIEDLSGGTFSISNGGIYGSLLSTPIINPPQSGILGMHKIQERPVVIEGKIEVRPMMYLALSYDHRIIDGKEAVTFLIRIKEAIESPERLLLDM
jgi:2-oxoglutarate dehydrogenase E2 component (dihydrolipoamide succinyltransferase)